MREKADYLHEAVFHVDIGLYNVVPLVGAMRLTALSARQLAHAADIYDRMLCDRDCGITLCLAGPLVSAGLKKIFADVIRCNMADAVVATAAVVVEDFFEALGFCHYLAAEHLKTGAEDETLRRLSIQRNDDILVDADQRRACDETIRNIADETPPGAYSSRELVCRMGAYLDGQETKPADSILYEAHKAGMPVFCPPPTDEAASPGFGLVARRVGGEQGQTVTVDAAKDFRELVRIGKETPRSGLLVIGAAPDDFLRNMVAAAESLGVEVPGYEYVVEIAAADGRGGGAASEAGRPPKSAPTTTLGKTAACAKSHPGQRQTVSIEATVSVPLIVGYVYHLAHWLGRPNRDYNRLLG